MKKRLKKRSLASVLAIIMILSLFAGCANGVGDPLDTTVDGSSVQTGVTDPAKKKIAFTFDDGPHAPAEDIDEGYFPYTTYILDKLEQLGMKATFFVVGERAERYGAAILRAISLGCEVGSHTYSHTSFKNMSTDSVEQILKAASAAISVTGAPAPSLFRAVGGDISEEQLAVTASLGYSVIGWNIDPEDWNGHPKTWDKFSEDPERNERYENFVNEKVEHIVSQADDGDIVLLHDIYMSSVDIFIRAADKLVEAGFELVTVSELLGLEKEEARPVIYVSKGETITSMG